MSECIHKHVECGLEPGAMASLTTTLPGTPPLSLSLNCARTVKGNVCATEVQQALCQNKRFIENIRPGAQILSSGTMQKDDSALNVRRFFQS